MTWPWVSRKEFEAACMVTDAYREIADGAIAQCKRLQAENDDLKVELAALKMIHQNVHQFAEHLG